MTPFSITFTVPGAAVPKARPRVTRQNGKARTYTPEKTVSFENLVSWTAKQAMEGQEMHVGPVRAVICIALPVPKWSGKRTDMAFAGEIAPTKKPDMDNIIKALFDAMNGIVFKDDSQIVSALVEKRYGVNPGTYIKIESTGQEAAK